MIRDGVLLVLLVLLIIWGDGGARTRFGARSGVVGSNASDDGVCGAAGDADDGGS